ncbi:transporter substrate-binding domain-containing protein [Ectopseudomonas mendocina]|uniref:Transporter substrate-binding domain-containing protein n=1 Tax=Ectopseudomonas mendocina TaxID=300 RepID=A0ABZ2REH2_ECTME
MRLITCLTLAALLICNAQADETRQSKPLVHVGYYEFAPYTYTDSDNLPRGSLIEITVRLLERAGYQAEFRSYPNARLYQGLHDGTIHIWPGAAGKADLKDLTLESRSMLGEVPLNLYFRPETARPNLPEGLKDKRLIVLNGYTYWSPVSHWLDDPQLNIQQLKTNSHASALAMLLHKRGDYLLDYKAPIELERKNMNIADLKHIQLQFIQSKLVISKKAPNAETLLDDLDQAYDALTAEGVELNLH